MLWLVICYLWWYLWLCVQTDQSCHIFRVHSPLSGDRPSLPTVHNCTCRGWNSCPGLSGSESRSPSGHSPCSIGLMLQNDGEPGRTSDFHEHNPLMHLISCEMSSLVRSNAVWNATTVNKIFGEPMEGDVDRSIVGREDKSISRITSYSIKKKKKYFQNVSCPM